MREKIIQPVTCDGYRAFAKIQFSDDGVLSISGVVGPFSNGNCHGSSGQCVEAIREGTPSKRWTSAMVTKFCDIWEEWYLNDLHSECEHQKSLGWVEQASELIDQYSWVLSSPQLREVSNRIALDVINGRVPEITDEERMAYNAPRWAVTATNAPPEPQSFYVSDATPYERVRRGSAWYKNGTLGRSDPRGLLLKPCPVCGHEYGNGWLKVEVPKEVIQWLFSLPNSPTKPAWC